MLYVGRIFSGICQGFCNSLNYIYVLDFCLNFKEKAICGVILTLIGNFGTLIVYILGIFLNWRQLAGVCVLCGVPYVLGLIVCLPTVSAVLRPAGSQYDWKLFLDSAGTI